MGVIMAWEKAKNVLGKKIEIPLEYTWGGS